MDFGSNSVLERVAFDLKCVLHRVRVSQCRPSRVVQNPTGRPPGLGSHIDHILIVVDLIFFRSHLVSQSVWSLFCVCMFVAPPEFWDILVIWSREQGALPLTFW